MPDEEYTAEEFAQHVGDVTDRPTYDPTSDKEKIGESLQKLATNVDGEPAIITRWVACAEYIDVETGVRGLTWALSEGLPVYDAKMFFDIGGGFMAQKMGGR